jgi:conjugal transfer pilus assembly protein TraW
MRRGAFLLLLLSPFAAAQAPEGMIMTPPPASAADQAFMRQLEAQRKAQAEGKAVDRNAKPADEAFLRQLDAQRKGLEDRGARAVELPSAPPKAAAAAKPSGTATTANRAAAAPRAMPAAPAAPEAPPTLDEDLEAIAETEGLVQPDQGETARDPTKTLVFISLSMPETDLKALFQQGRGREDVTFVLRGWMPPHFTAVAGRVRNLMREAGGDDINVVIDPFPFRAYRVSQVPVFIHQRSEGDWRRLTGAVSLDRAIDEIERGNFNHTLGATYRVAEPDIVEEIQKRADAFDWDKEKAKLAERAMTNLDGGKPLVALPRAQATREFFVDPSITLVDDVVGTDGTVAAPKGATINPFSFMAFSKSFVAFDPDDPKQVAVAKRWLKEHAPAMLLATHLPPPAKGKPTLAQSFGQSVYPLSPELVARFGLAAVPSLVRQNGLLLQINEQRP